MGNCSKSARRGLCVFLAASCLSLMAQSERGSIRGTVLDSTGAVVAAAKVTAVNVATGVRTRDGHDGGGKL